jgi:hypothetical protein
VLSLETEWLRHTGGGAYDGYEPWEFVGFLIRYWGQYRLEEVAEEKKGLVFRQAVDSLLEVYRPSGELRCRRTISGVAPDTEDDLDWEEEEDDGSFYGTDEPGWDFPPGDPGFDASERPLVGDRVLFRFEARGFIVDESTGLEIVSLPVHRATVDGTLVEDRSNKEWGTETDVSWAARWP